MFGRTWIILIFILDCINFLAHILYPGSHNKWKPESDFDIDQIWPNLDQNLSKLIFLHIFDLIWVDLKFSFFLIFFCKFGQNLDKFVLSVHFLSYFDLILSFLNIIFEHKTQVRTPMVKAQVMCYTVNHQIRYVFSRARTFH